MTDSLTQWDARIEPETSRLVEQVMAKVTRSPLVVVDIGANTGKFVDLIADEYRVARAVMVEPVPEYAQFCGDRFLNCVYTPWTVDVVAKGIAGIAGPRALHVSTSANKGWNTMVASKANAENSERTLEVECITFADLCEQYQIDGCDILKIDVEGLEYEILPGVVQVISKWKRKPVIAVEIGWGTKNPGILTIRASLAALELMGYPKTRVVLDRTHDIVVAPK